MATRSQASSQKLPVKHIDQLRRRNKRLRKLQFETVEPRTLLTSQGFLQGVAFFDNNLNSIYDTGDAPKIDARIELHDSSGNFLVATTTDVNGKYVFTGLESGTYRLFEPSQPTYASHGTQILSQLNPAIALDNQTIQVTVVDPQNVQVSMPLSASTSVFRNITFELFGNSHTNAAGTHLVTLSGSAGSSQFYSYCLNLFQDLNLGANNFPALPSPSAPGVDPSNFGRIAYLFNHYGTTAYGLSQPPSQVNAAALQLAIWELLYDSGSPVGAFTSGNVRNITPFGSTTAAQVTAIVQQATFYLQDSVGKNETAVYLDASMNGAVPDSQLGHQSLICTESYNFANHPIVGDLSITITPDATNEVGDSHTFTVTVQQDLGDGIDSDGNGSPFDPVANAPVTVTLANLNGALAVPAGLLNGVTDSNGQFQVSFTSATAGLVIGNATTTVTVNGSPLTRDTDPTTATVAGPEGSGPATKRFVDAKIVITPDATNEVNDDHTFVVTVYANDGLNADQGGDGVTGFAPVAGEDVSVTLTNSNGASAPTGPFNGVTNASGQFEVTFTSATAGVVTGTATSQVDVGGLVLVRSTNGAANNSGPATKRFVDAKIVITPDATNEVNDDHTFVVTVYANDGLNADQGGDGVTGFAPVAGEDVSVTLTNSNGASAPTGPFNGVTNASGQFQVTFTSATAGIVTGTATSQVDVGGLVLVRSTNGAANNSGPATKRFVDAKIVITPDATNEVNDDHTFVVTVYANDGLNADQGGDGVTGFAPVAGEDVSVTLTNSNGASAPTGPFNGVTNASGQFQVTFTSATAGVVTGTATSQVDVGGLVLVRSTNGAANNSGPATKRFVDAKILIGPDGVNPVNDPHTFTVTVLVDDGLTAAQGGDGVTGFAAVSGASVTVTLTNSGGAVAVPVGPLAGVTNINGQFSVTFTSATAGQVVGNGSMSVIVGGVTLVRDTNPSTAATAGPGGSGPTLKTFVHRDIKLKKFTNGEDADTPAEAPLIAPGDTVTWTYQVENTGGLPYTSSEIVITDDAGTPGYAADDFSTTSGHIVLVSSSDVGNDGILSPGEVWIYEASAVAQNLTAPVGPPVSFYFGGNSSTDGTDGNIRIFTAGSISVKASAFSRDKSTGAWSTAYLGTYPGGLGVTDSSEGSGSGNSHTVDNSGRHNYVLFEFSETVVVDSAFLGYVVGDSDLTVWIGSMSDPFNNHLTLSDALLSSLGFTEVNLTSLTSSRTADFNAGNFAGNVLVIAARTGSDSDDFFKIEKVKVQTVEHACYQNYAVVTTGPGGPTSTDVSHYCNPDEEPSGTPGIDIEKYTNGKDADTAAEAPEIAPGGVVTWTYKVKNTGTIPFAYHEIVVVDDNGTPDDTSDDFAPTLVASSDVGNDGILSPQEVWTYQAIGVAEDLTAPSGSAISFDFSGNTSTDGSDGNIRTYTSGSVSVKTSAFSRDKSTGKWSTAYLGAYSGGLGVTDSSEGSGGSNSHTVDNNGRDNYVLFEFSETVVVDAAFLGYIVGDSDLTVWIGSANNPFVNHLTLSDALLSSMGFTEVNLSSVSSSGRWADFNDPEFAGNVLIIAAKTGESNDQFKIEKVKVNKVDSGIYRNVATVTVEGSSDEDASHYKNPQNVPVPDPSECVNVSYAFSGNTSTTGTKGNVRTYTKSNISVNVSAFSRTTGGSWSTAYLGAYSEGLGVTDTSESGSGGSHRTDNLGRLNYVLFEFSSLVTVDRAFLNSVVTDSDVSVWIGTSSNPFHNHLNLSDSVLNGMQHFEDNLTESSYSRWANINAAGVTGNVLVIAAWTGDETPDDQFKISKLDVCAKAVKFYTVDASADNTFEYGSGGQSLANYDLASDNTNPRGVASTAVGDKVWVVDGNRKVYVYNVDGKLLGSWTANGLSTPEDITTDGTNIWIVDDGSNKVFKFSNAAGRTSGSQSPTSSFNLSSSNSSPKGIVTDGSSLWVVNDNSTDKVFKYSKSGTLAGSWTIDSRNGSPTGITIDPSDVSHLWIVDSADDAVYRYNAAVGRTSGSQAAASVFDLASGNGNAQGIADPPPQGGSDGQGQVAVSEVASATTISVFVDSNTSPQIASELAALHLANQGLNRTSVFDGLFASGSAAFRSPFAEGNDDSRLVRSPLDVGSVPFQRSAADAALIDSLVSDDDSDWLDGDEVDSYASEELIDELALAAGAV